MQFNRSTSGHSLAHSLRPCDGGGVGGGGGTGSLSGKQMANVSLMPHNGGSQRRRQWQRRWRWQQQLPAASKICNIHQSHSTHRWPGMRMSSRAALERSNSFRIRIRIHSIRITVRAGSGSGSGCACGALIFLGLGLICLAHFQVNYTYLWHLRHSNIENQCGGSLA